MLQQPLRLPVVMAAVAMVVPEVMRAPVAMEVTVSTEAARDLTRAPAVPLQEAMALEDTALEDTVPEVMGHRWEATVEKAWPIMLTAE